jgi:hypothetical protein
MRLYLFDGRTSKKRKDLISLLVCLYGAARDFSYYLLLERRYRSLRATNIENNASIRVYNSYNKLYRPAMSTSAHEDQQMPDAGSNAHSDQPETEDKGATSLSSAEESVDGSEVDALLIGPDVSALAAVALLPARWPDADGYLAKILSKSRVIPGGKGRDNLLVFKYLASNSPKQQIL